MHPNNTSVGVKERPLNPETHCDPEDYLDLLYNQPAAIHFYLKDDKEWWVAHTDDHPGGELDGPWVFWTTYPTGPWDVDYFTEEIARFHLDELWYGPVGEQQHSIHRARLVPIEDAPEFVRDVVA